MKYPNLRVELKSGIFIITISREDKLNALNQETIKSLDLAFQQVYDEPEIKGVIITGAGEKAFVAGADIAEFTELNYMNGRKFSEDGQEVFAKIENCPKPVIAAVNGYALGGGCELAMACHMRIASENALFGQPEVKLGIIPGFGGTQRMTMLVGKGKAFELILSGNTIQADEALKIGLVNHVVAHDEVIAKTTELMESILGRAALAVAHGIDCINAVHSNDDGYQTEANSFGNCCKTEDFKEGTTAFLEKRKPIFTGK
ncbi:enoyl-CoA hydratase-related protein [Flammeovirgaceae bacterium SG7u.111]|nr:enoyl-CoA hydratase-related protein [Flammeovirgaceae bacterium SG7u.132]WPO33495.1 enoyl-CoA hydratase-related protein [Flammeovirgaceae bacterium SG7u.111]